MSSVPHQEHILPLEIVVYSGVQQKLNVSCMCNFRSPLCHIIKEAAEARGSSVGETGIRIGSQHTRELVCTTVGETGILIGSQHTWEARVHIWSTAQG